MFGKIMSISDDAMRDFYFPLLTDISEEEYKRAILENPRDAKMRLAREIVAECHDEAKARRAEE